MSFGPIAHDETTPKATEESPWTKLFGLFKDDPDFAVIAAAIRAERESNDDFEGDPAVYRNPSEVVPIGQDNFWAEVRATIQAEKDAMGDEEIDPACYIAKGIWEQQLESSRIGGHIKLAATTSDHGNSGSISYLEVAVNLKRLHHQICCYPHHNHNQPYPQKSPLL